MLPLPIQTMKVLPKNYSLKSKIPHIKMQSKHFFVLTVILFSLSCKTQIANYVNNGGFEECGNCEDVTSVFKKPKYWDAIDTNKFFAELFSKNIPPYLVPKSTYTYQWPRHGSNYIGSSQYCGTCSYNTRGYPRNILRQKLEVGKVYCFSMYVNLTNQSTHAIDALGAFFSDSSNDTIKECSIPLTYLTPQIQNPVNNIILDTLNWTAITGTFVANGTEKYLMIGNFKNDANTNKILANPTNLPQNFSNYLFDDVSCIDIELPAFAGRDTAITPGDSVFIGRQPDIGIDEACMWYKLPVTITPTTAALDTVAGIWVKPVVTTTYVVKQQLWCSGVKWDTVVIHMNPVGLEKIRLITEGLKLYPIPAKDYIELSIFNADLVKSFNSVSIYNSVGILLREEERYFENSILRINTENLPNGFYTLQLKNPGNETVHKRFVITK